MTMLKTVSVMPGERAGERGAALIMMLLISMMLLAAGGALIMTTVFSLSNSVDSTAETQAYYAAEAGAQTALNVLRGNVAPNPLFNTSSASANENKITFRQAVSTPTLSRWLSYNNSYTTPRVTLSSPYSTMNGMAYSVAVSDPDNTGTVIFSMSGVFPAPAGANTATLTVGTTNQTRATITYTAPATNPATINSTGTAPFGSFRIAPVNGSFNTFDIATSYPQGLDFNLTVRQTSPYPSSSSSPTTVVLACKLTGVISSTPAQHTARLTIVASSTNPTSTSNNIGGVLYERTTNTFPLAYNASSAISPVTVTAPPPMRLLVKVRGYGPRAAEKRLQMMVHRFSMDYTANAALSLRSADSGARMLNFSVGESARYAYSGFDNSGGAGLPAVAVTNDADQSYVTNELIGNTQVTGTSPVQKVSISSLPTFLQTAQAARAAVSELRERAQGEYWSSNPSNTTFDETTDRYFPSGTTPNTYGTETNPVLTFVDGDAALPPAGGAGLLIVTGTMDMRGAADFKGLVLVLGEGKLQRNGGGNGTTLGSVVIASFGATGDFTSPFFDSNGSGNSGLSYDSKWVEKAMMSGGPGVRGISEY